MVSFLYIFQIKKKRTAMTVLYSFVVDVYLLVFSIYMLLGKEICHTGLVRHKRIDPCLAMLTSILKILI